MEWMKSRNQILVTVDNTPYHKIQIPHCHITTTEWILFTEQHKSHINYFYLLQHENKRRKENKGVRNLYMEWLWLSGSVTDAEKSRKPLHTKAKERHWHLLTSVFCCYAPHESCLVKFLLLHQEEVKVFASWKKDFLRLSIKLLCLSSYFRTIVAYTLRWHIS